MKKWTWEGGEPVSKDEKRAILWSHYTRGVRRLLSVKKPCGCARWLAIGPHSTYCTAHVRQRLGF